MVICGKHNELDVERLAALCERWRMQDDRAEAELRALMAAWLVPNPPRDPLLALLRAVTGIPGPGEREWAASAVLVTILSRGAFPLARALHAPDTAVASALTERDYWLASAGQHIEATSSRQRAELLAAAIDRFLRVKWPTWRASGDPPLAATPLDSKLFFAATAAANGRVPVALGWRRLFDILAAARAVE